MAGDGLVPPLNAPPAGQLTPGVQPGTTPGIVLAQYVIVFGTAGGVFIYSGTPALGNPPIYSVTNAATDPYGNTVLQGFTAYHGSSFIEIFESTSLGTPAIVMGSGAASETEHAEIYNSIVNPGLVNELIELNIIGPLSSAANTAQGLFQLVSAAADGSTLAGGVIYNITGGLPSNFAHWNYEGFSIDAGSVTAAEPGTGTSDTNPATAESWHTLSLTTVTASGNGVNGFRYKLLATNTLLLEWDLATNSVGNSVTVATLPAGWRPAKAHNIGMSTYGGSTALTTAVNPHFTVNTNGTIVTGGFPASAFDVCGTALIGMD